MVGSTSTCHPFAAGAGIVRYEVISGLRVKIPSDCPKSIDGTNVWNQSQRSAGLDVSRRMFQSKGATRVCFSQDVKCGCQYVRGDSKSRLLRFTV